MSQRSKQRASHTR